jgi:ankyrin repeat protein
MELFAAIEAKNVGQVRALLAGDPSRANARNDAGLSPVLAAQYSHQPEMVREILDARPELDLFDAAAVGDLDRLAELLDADPSAVNAYAADGFFPLALAAYFDRPAAVRLLLDRGADVGQAATNAMQVQALHAAVAGRSYESVKALLEAGADANAVQHGGYTPLMAAEQYNDTATVELLRQFGATPSSG